MHIPPYYKKPNWQRFFVGAFFGALISYFVLMYMYGTMYEELFEENSNLQSELTSANNKIKVLEETNQNLDEKSKKSLTVNTIELKIENAKQLKLDTLITHQLEELVKEEISHIIGQEITIVMESNELIRSSIENKNFEVDDFRYTFEIKTLMISQTVQLLVEAKVSN